MTLGELKKILAEFPDDFNDIDIVRAVPGSFVQIGDVVPYLTRESTKAQEIKEVHGPGGDEESEGDSPVIVIW